MNANHTPGPWFIEKNGNYIDITASEGSGFKSERYMRVRGCIELSDARLIAAAPELLEALVNMVEWIQPDGSFPDNLTVRSAIKEAHTAIAKATGA